MSKKYLLIFTAVIMTGLTIGCSNKVNNINFVPDYTQLNSTPKKQGPITIQVKLDTPPFVSAQANELSGIALMDDGKIIKYQTLKTGTTFTATTIVYESKWVKIESHPTTGSEAQT